MLEVKVIDSLRIQDVVAIHKDAFKNFFLTTLGDKFLYCYYKSLQSHSDGLLLGCFDGDIMLGFCAVAKHSKGFNKRLVKSNLFRFVMLGIYILLTRPLALLRLFRNFSKVSSPEWDDCDFCELMSIGVLSSAQGKGVGSRLLSKLEERLTHENYEYLSLTTDYDDNDNAIAFYKSNDYSIMFDFIAYPNRHMYRMVKKLVK